jgi:hypothetical protein
MCVTIVPLAIHKYNYHSPVIKPHTEAKPPWKRDILLFHLAQFCSPNMSDTAKEILGNRMTSQRMRLRAHEGHSRKGKERKSRDLTAQQCAAAETINTNKTLYVMRTPANHRLEQRFPNQSIRPLATLMPSYGIPRNTLHDQILIQNVVFIWNFSLDLWPISATQRKNVHILNF